MANNFFEAPQPNFGLIQECHQTLAVELGHCANMPTIREGEAILAAINGVRGCLGVMNQRLDEMNQRLDRVASRQREQRLDGVEQRLGEMSERLDKMSISPG
jgi:hypothetical protein